MTAKELMIGDLVDYRGKVIEVTSLYAKNGSNEVGFGNKESTWVQGYVLKPIPLTPEILEKNFLKRHGAYVILDDYFEVEICEYNDGLYRLLYICTEMSLPRTQITEIGFVHQLQHALQMVGVVQEITL